MEIVCLRNIRINTLHEGDDDDVDNNNNNNDNINDILSLYFRTDLVVVY